MRKFFQVSLRYEFIFRSAARLLNGAYEGDSYLFMKTHMGDGVGTDFVPSVASSDMSWNSSDSLS